MAILYKDWGKHLRWGNFFLLYINLLSIAERAGNKLILPPYFAWQYFEFPPESDNGIQQDELFHFRQPNYTKEEEEYLVNYFKENRDKNICINLGSHLQAEEWHLANKDYVVKMMELKEEEVNKVREKYKHILDNGKKTIGIGIRRGDFIGSPCFYQLPLSWYIDALKEEFPDWKDRNILFFSDHIEEIKGLFKGDNFYFADPNGTHTHADNFKHYHKNPMEQFILGTLCDDFIGGSSTFSWAQMWYIHNKGGKVVYSNRNLLGECAKNHYNPHYYPISWTKFEKGLN